MTDLAIRLEDVGKRYRLSTGPRATSAGELAGRLLRGGRRGARQDFWALRHVSFELRHGETLGIIGPNGAGKSTLLKILARVTEPTEGSGEIHGRMTSLLDVGAGFHPELTGRDNVFLYGAVLGMRRAETAARFVEIVEFAEVEHFIDQPVKRYSTGMYLRLAFAVVAHLDPEILLVDEALSVGDEVFQERSLGRIEEMMRAGRTVVFVSHDAGAVARLCERGLLLEGGQVAFAGPIEEAIERYRDHRGGPRAEAEGVASG